MKPTAIIPLFYFKNTITFYTQPQYQAMKHRELNLMQTKDHVRQHLIRT